MFNQEFIEQVKQATDMVKLAKRYTTLTPAGGGVWMGPCPSPNHRDSDPSFRVWEHDKSWACMGCHNGRKDIKNGIYGSDCFAFIQWVSGGKTNWRNAVVQLAQEAGIPLPDSDIERSYKEKRDLARCYMNSVHGRPLNYLVSRGLDRSDIDEWWIGFDGIKITFPLFDRYRNVLGFSKRWLDAPLDCGDKYRNSSNSKVFNKSCYFYGMHNFDHDFNEIRITEGVLDVILPHKYGVRNIVATLGTSFTESHADLIKSWGVTPVFCMDGDPSGFKGIKKSIELMAERGVYSKVLLLPDGIDMADLANRLGSSTEQYIQDNAITYGFFKVRDLIQRYEAQVLEIKLKHYPELVKIVDSIPTEAERKIISDMINHHMQIDFNLKMN